MEMKVGNESVCSSFHILRGSGMTAYIYLLSSFANTYPYRDSQNHGTTHLQEKIKNI